MPEGQKLFLYARKSTDDKDKQVQSIPDQIAELRTFARREGIQVVEMLTEKQSAKAPGRNVFEAMLDRIAEGEVGVTGIVDRKYKAERVYRDEYDLENKLQTRNAEIDYSKGTDSRKLFESDSI